MSKKLEQVRARVLVKNCDAKPEEAVGEKQTTKTEKQRSLINSLSNMKIDTINIEQLTKLIINEFDITDEHTIRNWKRWLEVKGYVKLSGKEYIINKELLTETQPNKLTRPSFAEGS